MKEIIRAAFVIARRDFTAIIYSKAFIFFLLGPLFPLLIGVAAGSLGGKIAEDATKPVIGIAMDPASTAKMTETRETLAKQLGEGWFPELKSLAPVGSGGQSPEIYLADKKNNLDAVVSGTLEKPTLTATPGAADRYDDEIALLASYAISGQSKELPKVEINTVTKSAGNAKQVRILTGQAAQVLVFMLTMLLAGMVLSNLVEEKANKIIEILAASIPMESVFLGKLFAMLAMSFLGIFVWGSVGLGITLLAGGGALPSLPTPAVGWPMFSALCVLYFALAYLMLGALFLGIGAMAATVREVQTLSMPVTMLQLLNFFFASYTVTKLNTPIEKAAAIFPFSSPFAMVARAAQEPTLWHHGVAIIGQIFFAVLLLRLGVYLFKRNVMKSGSGGKIKAGDEKRKLFGIIPMGGKA
jgi:ABC-2 type transport system permease protein